MSTVSLVTTMKTTLILAASFLGNAVAESSFSIVRDGTCSAAGKEAVVNSTVCATINDFSQVSGLLFGMECIVIQSKVEFPIGEGPNGCFFGKFGGKCFVNWNEPGSQNEDSFSLGFPGICQEVLPSANQDPHITNAYGKHFELRQDGRYNMLTVSRNEMSEFKLFADLFRIDQKSCAPAYIRKLNIVTGQTTFSIRRGIQNNFTETTISDGFDVQMANQEWISHSSLSQQQYTIGDLKVDLGGSVDCRDSVSVRRDCRHVGVVSPHVEVRVEAGQSPNSKRYFLNLQIVKLNVSEATVSGVLWGDNYDQLAHC